MCLLTGFTSYLLAILICDSKSGIDRTCMKTLEQGLKIKMLMTNRKSYLNNLITTEMVTCE